MKGYEVKDLREERERPNQNANIATNKRIMQSARGGRKGKMATRAGGRERRGKEKEKEEKQKRNAPRGL